MLALFSSPGFAQQPSDAAALRAEVARLRQELDALEAKLAAFEGAQPAPAAATAPAPEPTPAALPVDAGAAAANSKVFNPDTSVLANFVGVAGKNPVSDQPSLQLTEVEAAFQAVVDPYARADFFLSAGPDGLEVEEGFITFTSLPANLLLKVGKMRAQFGKVNTIPHARDADGRSTARDRKPRRRRRGPLRQRVSLSKLMMNPLLFIEATGEVFSGNSHVFQSAERSKLNYVGRLRGYRDLTEGTNIDLGTSVAFGPTNLGVDMNKRLVGVDATFRYRPVAPRHLQALPGAHGAGLEPAGLAGGRQAECVRLLRPGRISVRAPVVLRRSIRSISARARRVAPGHRRFGVPDVLAERVQPASRPVSPHRTTAKA